MISLNYINLNYIFAYSIYSLLLYIFNQKNCRKGVRNHSDRQGILRKKEKSNAWVCGFAKNYF